MNLVRRPPLLKFGAAFCICFLALGLTLVTSLATSSSFLLFIVVILLSTRFGGWGPGLFATLFAVAANIYIFFPSVDIFDLASFGLGAILIVILGSYDLSTQQKSAKTQSLNEELDQRIAQRAIELEEANRKLEVEIYEHRRVEEQMRLLAAHLQSAREEERMYVAREIHDEIGTLMTAVKMDLAFLGRAMNGNSPHKSPEELRADINATTKLVDEAIESVHQIARELRPGVLDHLGLRAALEWQMQEFQERSKIECQFNSDLEELVLDPARSTAVFRIMQEALTNVARHAHATRVEASLQKEDNHLILLVRDNGIGIPQDPDVHRFGILGMRERAHVFGGDVFIHGVPGQGTSVTVRIPI